MTKKTEFDRKIEDLMRMANAAKANGNDRIYKLLRDSARLLMKEKVNA